MENIQQRKEVKVNMFDISIIMSTYNDEKTIRDCIDSVLNQTYSNFEFIIINDCSTDNTLEIIESFKDNRIKIISNRKNMGLTSNLIGALKISNGKYIARMDADDICTKKRLEMQINYLNEKQNVDILGTNAIIINDEGKEIGVTNKPLKHDDIVNGLIIENQLIHPSVMMRKEIFEKINYDLAFKTCQDYKLWVDAVNICTFANLADNCIFYRISKKGISKTQRKNIEERAKVLSDIHTELLKKKKLKLSNQNVSDYTKIVMGEKIDVDSLNELREVIKTISNQTNIKFLLKLISDKKIDCQGVKTSLLELQFIDIYNSFVIKMLLLRKYCKYLGFFKSIKILFIKRIFGKD